MARPREFDPGEALARAMDAFWAKGFEGTSLADLMAATGLNKASRYAAFGDKRRLYLAAVERYERDGIDQTIARLREAADPAATIAAVFDGVIAAAARGDRRGCLLCNASIDRAPYDPAVERRVLSALARLQRAITGALRRADPQAPSAAIAARASHLLATYMGLRTIAPP